MAPYENSLFSEFTRLSLQQQQQQQKGLEQLACFSWHRQTHKHGKTLSSNSVSRPARNPSELIAED